MLFDLRSRGRRRTVQGVYLFLAILLGGGLVLFGVGAGNGLGGLLNAFNGGGSSSGQKAVVSSQEKQRDQGDAAEPEQIRRPGPTSLQARWTSAGQGADFNSSTGQFTKAGLNELGLATQAWQQYLKLTKNPDPNLAVLAARAYAGQSNYAGEASAWDIETLADPAAVKGFECLAVSAYAAGQTRKGDLAAAKAAQPGPQGPAGAAQEPDQHGQDPAFGRAAVLTAPTRDRRVTSPQGPLAQLVEQGTLNPKVGGSSPPRPTSKAPHSGVFSFSGPRRVPSGGAGAYRGPPAIAVGPLRRRRSFEHRLRVGDGSARG